MTFEPSSAERRKYLHYSVDRREARRPVSISYDADGAKIRLVVDFLRIPSTQEFRWRPRLGISDNELVVAERMARRLPRGWWAEYPDEWFKHRFATGSSYFWFQAQGFRIGSQSDLFERWELELKEPMRLTLAA